MLEQMNHAPNRQDRLPAFPRKAAKLLAIHDFWPLLSPRFSAAVSKDVSKEAGIRNRGSLSPADVDALPGARAIGAPDRIPGPYRTLTEAAP